MDMGTWARVGSRTSGIVAISAVVLLAAAYLLWRVSGGAEPGRGPVEPGMLMFVELADGANNVMAANLDDPVGTRQVTAQRCLRFYTSNSTSVCLKVSGVGPTYAAEVLDGDGAVVRTVDLPGVPSRARVSASGNIVTWTSFVAGDSYSVPGGFSTRSGFFDMRTDTLLESIETFRAEIEGAPVTALDVNYWGMTVAKDDRTFYATLATGGRTWLVRGDLVERTVRSVLQNAECPSLSPDGTRVAYKKRTSRLGPWDLTVLDLASMIETRLPGTAGIDDQAEWLDNNRLAYGAVPPGARAGAIYVVGSSGSTAARVAIPDAASPSIVR